MHLRNTYKKNTTFFSKGCIVKIVTKEKLYYFLRFKTNKDHSTSQLSDPFIFGQSKFDCSSSNQQNVHLSKNTSWKVKLNSILYQWQCTKPFILGTTRVGRITTSFDATLFFTLGRPAHRRRRLKHWLDC